MNLLPTLFRRAANAQPQQAAKGAGPVVLASSQLKAVVGAGPNGTWKTTAGPNGTW